MYLAIAPRTIAVVVAVNLSALLSPIAMAADGVYVELQGALVRPLKGDGSVSTPPAIPLGNPTFTRSELEYKKDFAVGGAVGYDWNGARAELQVQQLLGNTIKDPGATTIASDEIKGTAGFFNLWFGFGDAALQPYIGGGLGAIQKKYSGAKKTNAAAQLGAGLNWFVTPRFVFDLGYRFLSTERATFERGSSSYDADFDAHTVLAGLRLNFGSTPPPAPAPVEPLPVAVVPLPPAACSDGSDNDGDGLIDYPQDPGCSAADDNDETDLPACADGRDNDGDGVIDFPSDKGCTAVDDNDEKDVCKAPQPGERVSLSGCGTGDHMVLRGVNFNFDKATLTPDARTILDGVADELLAYPKINIEIAGHTDGKGSDSYNQRLSEDRAASVVAYLESRGIAAERLTSVGYGETQPVADNESDEGRELNRRVELKIR